MTTDPLAKRVADRFDVMRNERMGYERTWQDIRELVRPHTSDFQKMYSPGSLKTDAIYDGTAPEALEELASGLHSYLTNPADRWFAIETTNMQAVENDPDALLWLEEVADRIFTEFANPMVNFNGTLHEAYLDLGAFGTAVIGQEYSVDTGHLVFRAYPLADCYIEENDDGMVDTLFRCLTYSTRQMIQRHESKDRDRFEQLPKQVLDDAVKGRGDKKWQVIHAVHRRSGRDPLKYTSTNMPFSSCWVMKEPLFLLRESGYTSFPYHVPRWTKLASENYGRSPAWKCLPDIKMLNRMEYTIIKAAQKATDPPLVVPNDGFMLPIRTAPNSLIMKEPGADEIQSLEHKGNFPVAFEMTEQRRDSIRRAFFADWLRLSSQLKKERQSMYEIQEIMEEQLRMVAPILGRTETELLSPLIQRAYELLHERNRFRPAPASIQRNAAGNLKVVSISPAARAQKGVKAAQIGRFIQEILPLAQVDPTALDALDTDAVVQEMALYRGTPRRIIRSTEEIIALRESRQQAQAAQQMVEVAKPASEAIKNLATAQESGSTILGGSVF